MNVLADFHHFDLYYSLQLLFEKRLGWELYRPIGMDWFEGGYWKIAEPYGNNPDTVRQYLDINTMAWDPHKNLNGGTNNYEKDGVYHIWDPIHEIFQKAITLEKFKEIPIDIVISSYQPHDESFARLIKDYKPKVKHIAQMGNTYQTTEVKNVMCSTMPYPIPPDKNVVFYHQEFDLDVFKYSPPQATSKITSFVNLLPMPEVYRLYKSRLPDFDFKAYGAGSLDGTITGLGAISKIMSESDFGWHIKPGGDGFGHIIHNWFACGRPVLTNFSDYNDKLAGFLLQDGKTALNLEACGFEENINRILYYSIPENYQAMCEDAHKKFKEVVDFDREFIELKKFLEKII